MHMFHEGLFHRMPVNIIHDNITKKHWKHFYILYWALIGWLQDAFPEGGGGTGVLSTVPSALTRWTEEARVLDGNSMHDCVTGTAQHCSGGTGYTESCGAYLNKK